MTAFLLVTLAWCSFTRPVAAQLPGGTPVARPGWGWPRMSPPATPHPAVVRVLVNERDGMAAGSGTLIQKTDHYGLVVTNWHVVRDAAGAITVVFPDGYRSAAQVARTDADWDLAALIVWRPRVEPIGLAARVPRPGDRLTIAGYGSGKYRVARGRATQYVAPNDRLPYEMVEVSVAARDGDSGGPILNERGELAGVLFGSAGRNTSGSHIAAVRRFLDPVGRLLAQHDQPRPSQPAAPLATTTQPTTPTEPPRQMPPAVRFDPPVGQVVGDGAAAPPLVANPPPPVNDRVPDLVPLPPLPPAEAPRIPESDVAAAAPRDPPAERSQIPVPRHEPAASKPAEPRRQLAGAVGMRPIAPPADDGGLDSVPGGRGHAAVADTVSTRAPHDDHELDWRDWFGRNLFDQVKTVLALVGIVAVAAFCLGRAASRYRDSEEYDDEEDFE